MMSVKARKRSPNWLPSEKYLLLDLAELHCNIIENKKTDGASVMRKNIEWQLISKEYNSRTTHCPRTPENLKAQWESLKKNAKKEEIAIRNNTSDEPELENKKEDSFRKRIIDLIQKTAPGSFNPLEIDCTSNSLDPDLSNKTANSLSDQGSNKDNTEELEVSEEEIQDWNVYTPTILVTPKSKQTEVDNNVSDETSTSRQTQQSACIKRLHKSKIEAIALHKFSAQRKLANMAEIHKLDILIKREQLKQEKFKTRLLLLDIRLKKKQLDKELINNL